MLRWCIIIINVLPYALCMRFQTGIHTGNSEHAVTRTCIHVCVVPYMLVCTSVFLTMLAVYIQSCMRIPSCRNLSHLRKYLRARAHTHTHTHKCICAHSSALLSEQSHMCMHLCMRVLICKIMIYLYDICVCVCVFSYSYMYSCHN